MVMRTLSAVGQYFSEAWNAWFSPDLGDYQYIGISGSGLRSIIFGILIGFFVACCMTVFDRRVLGDFVRHVLANDCLSKEKAMTLEELGYLRNTIIRSSLKNGVSLRRVIKCVEEEDFRREIALRREAFLAENAENKGARFKEPKFRVDPSTMHFYIPEELKYVADVKFEKKGANFVTLLLATLLFFALAAVAFFVVPDLLQMLDNMIGIFDSKNNILT